MISMRVVLVAALLLAAPRVAPAAPPQCTSPANLMGARWEVDRVVADAISLSSNKAQYDNPF